MSTDDLCLHTTISQATSCAHNIIYYEQKTHSTIFTILQCTGTVNGEAKKICDARDRCQTIQGITEATFSSISIDLLCLQVAQMPRSQASSGDFCGHNNDS